LNAVGRLIAHQRRMARSLAASWVIALFFTINPSAEPLKPAWSKPLGRGAGLVGVEEYGRCTVLASKTAIQVVLPSGEVSWTWPYAKVVRHLNPRDVAVSHECDAVALPGDAGRKQVWVAQRNGTLTTLQLTTTPAEAAFDHTGQLVAVGTFSGSIHLYTRGGELKWTRETNASIVQGITFSDDNRRIAFNSFAGAGIVSVAGHVESSKRGSLDGALDGPDLSYRARIAVFEGGNRMWQRGEDGIECVDARGDVLAIIPAAAAFRTVKVSRDFAQVLVVSEKDLDPVSVERYEVPKPCRP
jgi:hypothetical protein